MIHCAVYHDHIQPSRQMLGCMFGIGSRTAKHCNERTPTNPRHTLLMPSPSFGACRTHQFVDFYRIAFAIGTQQLVKIVVKNAFFATQFVVTYFTIFLFFGYVVQTASGAFVIFQGKPPRVQFKRYVSTYEILANFVTPKRVTAKQF